MTLSPQLIWFLIGVAFLVAELLVPGIILIFFTAGSWIVGLSILLFDIDLTTQIAVFIVSSLILLFTLRKYCIRTFKGDTPDKVDESFGESKIGKTGIVTKTITPTIPGEIKVMGSFWRAVADCEIDEGQSVVIEEQDANDGLTFKVKMNEGDK